MSKNPQTVKTQNSNDRRTKAFSSRRRWQKSLIFDGCGVKKACYARHFDLQHNSNPTVPMYADGFELFVFGASLTSASLSKKQLFDRLDTPGSIEPGVLLWLPTNFNLWNRCFFKSWERFSLNPVASADPVFVSNQTAFMKICCILCDNFAGLQINNGVRSLIL